jgi:hypothetical protein
MLPYYIGFAGLVNGSVTAEAAAERFCSNIASKACEVAELASAGVVGENKATAVIATPATAVVVSCAAVNVSFTAVVASLAAAISSPKSWPGVAFGSAPLPTAIILVKTLAINFRNLVKQSESSCASFAGKLRIHAIIERRVAI